MSVFLRRVHELCYLHSLEIEQADDAASLCKSYDERASLAKARLPIEYLQDTNLQNAQVWVKPKKK